MRKFTSYMIDGNIIAAFILIPSIFRGYNNWYLYELIAWYAVLALILYIRQKARTAFLS